MLTKQEVFDRVVLHMAEQKERSVDKVQCRYRYFKDDGTVMRCAVGIFIEDRFYNEFIEGNDVYILAKHPSNVLGEAGVWVDLLGDLQAIHDANTTTEGLKQHLQELAKKKGLDGSMIEKITEWRSGGIC